MNENHTLSITTGSWVRAVAVVVAALALFAVKDLLLAILASVIIASAIEPAALWARRRNIPRIPTIISVYVGMAIILVGVIYFLLLPLIGEISVFLRGLPFSNEPALQVTSGASGPAWLENIQQSFSLGELGVYLNSLADSLSQGLFSSISVIFGGVLSFIIIIVLSFYLAAQEDGVGKFLKIITPYKHEAYVINLWKRSQAKIGLWVQGQMLLAAIVAVLVYLGLTIIGIEHALLLAVLAGAFELIPLFGAVLAAIPAIFVAYLGGGMPDLLLVAGLYIIIQQFENHLLYPLVVKKVVGVPPMVSIVALLVGGQLAGFLGVLISVPIAAALMELLSDFEARKMAEHHPVPPTLST
jgi:predicted PurR-regulated permease PerM